MKEETRYIANLTFTLTGAVALLIFGIISTYNACTVKVVGAFATIAGSQALAVAVYIIVAAACLLGAFLLFRKYRRA